MPSGTLNTTLNGATNIYHAHIVHPVRPTPAASKATDVVALIQVVVVLIVVGVLLSLINRYIPDGPEYPT